MHFRVVRKAGDCSSVAYDFRPVTISGSENAKIRCDDNSSELANIAMDRINFNFRMADDRGVVLPPLPLAVHKASYFVFEIYTRTVIR